MAVDTSFLSKIRIFTYCSPNYVLSSKGRRQRFAAATLSTGFKPYRRCVGYHGGVLHHFAPSPKDSGIVIPRSSSCLEEDATSQISTISFCRRLDECARVYWAFFFVLHGCTIINVVEHTFATWVNAFICKWKVNILSYLVACFSLCFITP